MSLVGLRVALLTWEPALDGLLASLPAHHQYFLLLLFYYLMPNKYDDDDDDFQEPCSR